MPKSIANEKNTIKYVVGLDSNYRRYVERYVNKHLYRTYDESTIDKSKIPPPLKRKKKEPSKKRNSPKKAKTKAKKLKSSKF